MDTRDTLFYAANFEPEISRMFRAFDEEKIEEAELFKNKSLDIVDNILSSKDINGAGQEEWALIKSLIEKYQELNRYERGIIQSFGLPFSYKFADSLMI